MGFFGFSPSLKAKEVVFKNTGQHCLSLICCPVTPTSICILHVPTFNSNLCIKKSCSYLSSSAFIWKASSSQSSSLWVNSLTSCCWAKHRCTCKVTNYGLPLGHFGSQSQTTALNSTYKQEIPISQINAMTVISDIHWALDKRWLVLVEEVNFKGKLHATRPLCQTSMPADISGQCLSNLTNTQSSDMTDECRG